MEGRVCNLVILSGFVSCTCVLLLITLGDASGICAVLLMVLQL